MKILPNNVELYLEQYGEGRPVLFSHGWLEDCSIWTHQIEPLAKEYRVIVYDQRGHGKSDKPKADYSIGTLADDIRAIIEGLNLENVNLVGFSMGGEAALSFCLKHPGKVSKLILVGSTAKMAWPMHVLNLFSYILPYRWISAYLSKRKCHNPSAETVNANFSRARQVPRQVAYRCLKEINKYDVRNIVSQIQVPTLIIIGEQDKLNFEGSQYLHRHIKDSKLHIVSNCGHTVMIEKPDEFTYLVQQFLLE